MPMYRGPSLGTFVTVGISGAAGTVQYVSGVTSANVSVADNTTNGVTGIAFTIQGQNCTGSATTGGLVNIWAGTGTGGNGGIRLGNSTGDVVRMGINPTGASTYTIQSAVTGYTVTQSSTTTAGGAAINLTAQSTSFEGGAGGSFNITAGNGTGATTGTGGSIALSTGSGTTGNGAITFRRAAVTTLTLTPIPTGSTSWTYANTVTQVVHQQTASSTGTGAAWSFTAQPTSFEGAVGGIMGVSAGNATGTTGTGGALNLSSGTGATANGSINFRAGTSPTVTFTPNPTGTAAWTYVAGVTSVIHQQTATASASGANHSLSAQSTTFGTGTVNGGNFTINGGAATGAATTNNGGDVLLSAGNASGAGTNNPGKVRLQQAGTTLFSIGDAGVVLAGTTVSTTGGTTVLTPAQYRFGRIVITGSLASNATIVLPATMGAEWIIDATAVVLGGFTLTLQANGVNWGTTIGTTNTYYVRYGGTGRLYGSALTP